MMRFLTAIFTIVLLFCTAADSMGARPRRSSKKVKTERRLTANELEKTRTQIKKNDAETKRQLNRLQSLTAQSQRSQKKIERLQNRIDSIDRRIKQLDDSITFMAKNLEILKSSFADNLRKSRARRQTMSDAAVVVSSSTFTEAYRRYRYMQELERWQIQKTDKIKDLSAQIVSHRKTAEQIRSRHSLALAELTAENKRLESTMSEAEEVVGNLKKKGASLKNVLEQKQLELKKLDDELDRIIAEEARIAAEEAKKAEEERLAQEARQKAEAARLEAEKARQARQDSTKRQTQDKKQDKKQDGKQETTPARPTPKKPESAMPKAPEPDKIIVMSGSFEANKGRMPFPVDGEYTIVSHFGLNSHREVSNVKINNSGIDIEARPGSNARAVFDGEISSIFRIGGYHNVVMVRHGNYLTVYAGLDNLLVKKGDKVKAGQSIGTIYSDADDDNRSVLHFELRRERTKLDPEEWLH